MAAGWSVMDALNRNSKAAAEDKPRARFRTKDISIRKMYSNDRNFYSMNGIEKLAQEILTVGLLENMTVMYAPSGNVNNNNAVNSNRFAPDCADKWTRSHAVGVVSANDRRKEPKSMPGNRRTTLS